MTVAGNVGSNVVTHPQMPELAFSDTGAARAERVRAILQAAAVAFPGDPCAARDWLHAPHPALFGVSPAAAAWHSERATRYAFAVLTRDTAALAAPGPDSRS